MMKRHNIVIFLLTLLTALLIFKLHLSLTRQFDPDELSYLHWTYLLTQGKLPYKDFFFFIAPVYPAFLTPLFLLPQGPEIALVGRLVMFGIYLLTLGVLYMLVKRTTGNTLIALLTILIFTAFPMTFDKTIEIRPDMMMTLLFLISILLFVDISINFYSKLPRAFPRPTSSSRLPFLRFFSSFDHINTFLGLNLDMSRQRAGLRALDGGPPARVRIQASLLLSGICFSLSFLVMFKIIFAVPAIIFLLVISKRDLKDIAFFLLGCSLPLAIFFFWLWSNHLLLPFFHSVTYDAAIANVGNSTFSFLTTLSPFPIMYVESGGVSFPWGINTLFWILAVPGFLLLLRDRPRVGICSLLLLGGAFLLLVLFPKPYVQYFIIPTIIISFAAAYTLMTLFTKRLVILFGFSLMLLASFIIQHQSRQSFRWQNTEQLQVLSDIGNIIRQDEPVYDMVGSYVFRPDGYFICCHAYTQFAHLLQKPIPNLTDSLIATKTKFLVMDQKGYVFWITAPPDQQFLLTHYLPTRYNKIYSLGSTFVCTNGSCIQQTLHGKPVEKAPGNTFQIVIDETYRISIDPPDQWVKINNKMYKNEEMTLFSPGTYMFAPSPLVKSLSIQLAR